MHINDETGEIKLDRPYSGPPLDSAAITPLTSTAHVASTEGKEDTGGGAGGGVAFTAEDLVTEAGRMGVLRRLVAAKMLCETMACIGEVEAKEKSIKGPEGAGKSLYGRAYERYACVSSTPPPPPVFALKSNPDHSHSLAAPLFSLTLLILILLFLLLPSFSPPQTVH